MPSASRNPTWCVVLNPFLTPPQHLATAPINSSQTPLLMIAVYPRSIHCGSSHPPKPLELTSSDARQSSSRQKPAATKPSAAPLLRPNQHLHETAKMPIAITILYPSVSDATFNLDYYLKTHMPLVSKEFGPHGLKGWKVSRYDNRPSLSDANQKADDRFLARIASSAPRPVRRLPTASSARSSTIPRRSLTRPSRTPRARFWAIYPTSPTRIPSSWSARLSVPTRDKFWGRQGSGRMGMGL